MVEDDLISFGKVKTGVLPANFCDGKGLYVVANNGQWCLAELGTVLPETMALYLNTPFLATYQGVYSFLKKRTYVCFASPEIYATVSLKPTTEEDSFIFSGISDIKSAVKFIKRKQEQEINFLVEVGAKGGKEIFVNLCISVYCQALIINNLLYSFGFMSMNEMKKQEFIANNDWLLKPRIIIHSRVQGFTLTINGVATFYRVLSQICHYWKMVLKALSLGGVQPIFRFISCKSEPLTTPKSRYSDFYLSSNVVEELAGYNELKFTAEEESELQGLLDKQRVVSKLKTRGVGITASFPTAPTFSYQSPPTPT